MAIPNTSITKTLELAPDNKKYTLYPDGVLPGGSAPSAPPEFTTSTTSSSITATITEANGATSYEVRVDAGTAQSGLTKTGLAAETTYSFQVKGINEFGESDWSTAVNETTAASGGGSSGGTSALAWQAPSGLIDQGELVLTSDTLTFEAPEKLVWLGFGEGWLYAQSDGTPLAQTINVGGEDLEYEYTTGEEARFVQTVNGRKVLRTTAHPGGDWTQAAGGMINWDTGSALSPSSPIFTFSRIRCDHGTVSNASFQWKQERIRATKNLSGDSNNSIYVTETTPDGSGDRFIAYTGTGVEALYTSLPTHGNGWQSFAWGWKPNTPDQSDGEVGVILLKDGDTGISVDQDPTNSGGGTIATLIKSEASERPRWVMAQDYIGNNNDATQDVNIERTDIYWQRGGTLFFLTDSATPSQVTKIVPLRVNGVASGSEVSLRLWKGLLSDYSSASVLVYDSVLNFLGSVELV